MACSNGLCLLRPRGARQDREWEARFAAVTDRELLLFARAPWMAEEWARPVTALPIAMTR